MTNPSVTKHGSAKPIGAYAKLVLQKNLTDHPPLRKGDPGVRAEAPFRV